MSTLKYLFLGYSALITLISFSLSDDLRNPQFYRICLYTGISSFLIGIISEIANMFKMKPCMFLILMSVPIIYLVYYRILFNMFKSWKGVDPYITSATSRVGDSPINGFWSNYPKDRKIMRSDFLFSFAQALIPIFTIMVLIYFAIELNR